MDVDVSEERRAVEVNQDLDGIGHRLREERVRVGLSQRELARRVGISPSLISQLESGLSKPSVGTLYGIVTELDVSLDRIIRGREYEAAPGEQESRQPKGPLVRPGERRVIELASGVRWEQLTPATEEGIDFLHAIYDVGGSSTPDNSLMRHHGREYAYVVSGTLGIQIGFEEYVMHPGDSICFDSTEPHRLFNLGEEPVHAIWFVMGRGSHPRSSPDS